MLKFISRFSVIIFAICAAIAPAAKFTISKLNGIPNAINAHGVAVGQGSDGLTLFQNGIGSTIVINDISGEPAYNVIGTYINDIGDIVGYAQTSSSYAKTFVLSHNGSLFDPSSLSAGAVYAGSISNSGVVSIGVTGLYTAQSAYLYDMNSQTLTEVPSLYRRYVDLDSVNNLASFTGISAPNANGLSAGVSNVLLGGYHAVSYDSTTGILTDLTLGFGDPNFYQNSSFSRDLNDSGSIVGDYGNQAFFYENGIMTILDPAPYGGLYTHQTSSALAINNSNEIVGWGCDVSNGFLSCDAFYNHNGKTLNLLDLVSNSSGWSVLNSAVDINDAGQIIGNGYFNGHYSGFILNPIVDGVPEPKNWALLILGFGGVGIAIRLKRPKYITAC